jgi:hypothetical protein
MNEGRRLQYLDAMGIQPWVSKERAAVLAVQAAIAESTESQDSAVNEREVPDGSIPLQDRVYEIGPGTGQTLLLCGRPAEASSPLASDIARCLDETPVWGWQAKNGPVPTSAVAGSDVAGLSLERAIKERLFTRVLVFGAGAAGEEGGSEVLRSARVIYAPPLAVLAKSPEQKRSLWLQLLGNGWVAR